MAGRLKESGKGQPSTEFRKSHALVIGINDYGNGIRPLTTPVSDATRLTQLLAEEHGYDVHLLVEGVTKERLEAVLTTELAQFVGEDDRLLLYFAGHGIALDGEDGPQGFLVPQDANAADRDTLLPMTELHGWLEALPCRHMLAILDCCFAGAFRWGASTRRIATEELEEIHQERYERFIKDKAWQAITSAAHNEEALDIVAGKAVGSRGVRQEMGELHSPFALALYEALQGEGDLIPKDGGDGVITAAELALYLRQRVELDAEKEVGHEQTPQLWPLKNHRRGEYIFLTLDYNELNLRSAPKLTHDLNPWRGLKAYDYDEDHARLFFGRDEEIHELATKVEEQPFTAVLGASGTGKSSLVKAGLLPHLLEEGKREYAAAEIESSWLILPPLRPGRTPVRSLHRLLTAELPDKDAAVKPLRLNVDAAALAELVAAWRVDNPGRKLLLVVDQLEELLTLAEDKERAHFLNLLAHLIKEHPKSFRLVITLRTDFEPQFDADSPLAARWEKSRYIVPPLDQADLRAVIEGPASVRVLYFDPPELVDDLISEVIQTPGALPLLSFALSEMYLHYVESGRDDRTLNEADYRDVSGVVGSLRKRANQVYNALPEDAHRETLRRMMLRMISVEGGELTRRRVHRSELDYPTEAENERVERILERLVDARLLVTDEDEGQPTIEPAHDALVLAWDYLLRWKRAADDYLPLQRRLAQASEDWRDAPPNEKPGRLWHGDSWLPRLARLLPAGILETAPRLPDESRMPDGMNHYRHRAILFLDSHFTRHLDRMGVADAPPDEERWFNTLETNFVWQSVQRRWRNTRWLWGSVAFAFGVVLLLAGLIFDANQNLEVANQDLTARLLHAQAREIVGQEPLEGMAVSLEGAVVASSVRVKQDILAELLIDLKNARIAHLSGDAAAIAPVLDGSRLFIDQRDGPDSLMSMDTGEIITLTAEVQRGTIIMRNQVVENKGFFRLGNSSYYLVVYAEHSGEIRSFDDPNYVQRLRAEVEQVLEFANTETVLIDYAGQPAQLLTDGVPVEQLSGEITDVESVQPLPIFSIAIDTGEGLVYELRSTENGARLAQLCGEPADLIPADNGPVVGINYAQNGACPVSEVVAIENLETIARHDEPISALYAVPGADNLIVSFESANSVMYSHDTSVPLDGSATGAVEIKGAPFFLVTYSDGPAQLRHRTGALEETFERPVEAVSSWDSVPYFVIHYAEAPKVPDFDLRAVSDATPLLGEFEERITFPRHPERSEIREWNIVADPGLPFLSVDLVGCSVRTLTGSCRYSYGTSILIDLGTNSRLVVSRLVKLHSPVEQISSYPAASLFGILYESGRLELRPISNPYEIAARSVPTDLVTIEPVSDSELLLFQYSRRPPELRWRHSLNGHQHSLCNTDIEQTPGVPWIGISLHPDCQEYLVNVETEKTVGDLGACREPYRLETSADRRYLSVDYCSLSDHLRDLVSGERIGSVGRIGYSGVYDVRVGQDRIAAVTADDEQVLNLGSGSTHYHWIEGMKAMAVRYASGATYLVDPTLPQRADNIVQQALPDGANLTDCSDEQCLYTFITRIGEYLEESPINWQSVCELVQSPLVAFDDKCSS